MNIRNTVFLFCLSIGILGLLGLMLASKKTNLEEGLIMPTLKLVANDAVDSLTIQFADRDKEKDKGQELEFFQDKGTWTSGENKIKVDSVLVEKILSEIKSAVKIDEDKPPPDNGVENPRITVTIKATYSKGGVKKTQDWWLKVGKTTKNKDIVFVLSSDRPSQVVAVAHAAIESLFHTDINGFRSKEPFEFKDTNVKHIVLVQSDKTELDLEKKDDDLWKIVKPPIGYADLEGEKSKEPPPPKLNPHEPKKDVETEAKGGVRLLIKNIQELKVESTEDFVPVNKKIELSTYGLGPNEESLRIEVTSSEMKGGDKKEVLLIGKKDPLSKDQWFACLAGDKGVFKLSGKKLDAIRKAVNDPKELRSKDILFVAKDKIDLIRLSRAKEEFLLGHPESKDWFLRFDGRSVKASDSAVRLLVDSLADGRIVIFADDAKDADLGLNEPIFTVGIYDGAKPRGDDKKADKKDEDKKDDKEKKDDKFALDGQPPVLDGKDLWVESAFKNGKPKAVTPKEDNLVKAEVVGDNVKFTQIGSADKEEKTIEFLVEGGKDGKDVEKFKVTVRKKPAATLYFGKVDTKKVEGKDKEVRAVKRVLLDGTEHRFYLTKELCDKIIPENVADKIFLTYLDTALPQFPLAEAETLVIEQTKKDKLDILRIKDGTWVFRNAIASEYLADTGKVRGMLGSLFNLNAEKWLQKIDAKTDLANFGLNPPALTITALIKKPDPKTVASVFGLLSGGSVLDVPLAGSSLLAGYDRKPHSWLPAGFDPKSAGAAFALDDADWQKATGIDFGQKVTLRVGKQMEDDKEKNKERWDYYALLTVEAPKDAKKEDIKEANDLLFLIPAELAKRFMKEDFYDRSPVLATQALLDVGAAMGMGPLDVGPLGGVVQAPLLNPAVWGLVDPLVLDFDPAKVEKIVFETRRYEKRDFVLVRDKLPEKPKEPEKGKDGKDMPKVADKKKEPSLTGQTWLDKSGLTIYTVNSENVNDLVIELSKLHGRFATLTDGQRGFHKLGPNDAVLKVVIYLEGSPAPITLTVGARLGTGNFALSNTWPRADIKSAGPPMQPVFIISDTAIQKALRGIEFFGKDLVEAAQ
jgi:hypothetical protein